MAVGTKRKRPSEQAPRDESYDSASEHGSTSVEASVAPFSVTYPSKASRKGKQEGQAASADPKTAMQASPAKAVVHVPYVVQPQSVWQGMKAYASFAVSGERISTNQNVFVNYSSIEHGADLSGDDAKMFWVAQVLEIRAVDSEHVYLRVNWFYWPRELPGGTLLYHGKNELIASNHMEIIDAMTITGKAIVKHWLETDEEENPSEIFWRQTYDVHKRKLSLLRKHCACHGYYNPDSMLVNCSNEDCKIWLHKECILRDVLSRVYKRLTSEETSNGGTKRKTPTKPAKSSVSPPAKPKQDPWEGMLKAQLSNKGKPEVAPKVVITDLGVGRTSTNGSTPKGTKRKAWEEDIFCLACKEKIV